MNKQMTYCGFVTIVGRPNVGKSTLLNQLLGQKISIVSHKPQTTRNLITGIHTEGPYQAIYIDTPGLHIKKQRVINRLMNRVASNSIDNAELIIFLAEGTYWTPDDEMVIKKLKNVNCPIVLTINKVDSVADKEKLLPHIQFLSQKIPFYCVIPICAKNGMNVKILSDTICKALPKSEHYFPKDCITNCSKHFIASEVIREKLIYFLGNELPYSIIVEIENFSRNDQGGYDIYGLILVERSSQKKIVIGNKGSKIKTIGIEARRDMEVIFKMQVSLKLWVKIKPRWNYDECVQHSLSYVNNF